MYSSTLGWNPRSQWSPPCGEAGTCWKLHGLSAAEAIENQTLPCSPAPWPLAGSSLEGCCLTGVLNSRQHWFYLCSVVNWASNKHPFLNAEVLLDTWSPFSRETRAEFHSLSCSLVLGTTSMVSILFPIPPALAKSLKDGFLDEEPSPLNPQRVPDPWFWQKGSHAHETRNLIFFLTAVRYKGCFSLSARSPHCWHLHLLRDFPSQNIHGPNERRGKFLWGLLNWM